MRRAALTLVLALALTSTAWAAGFTAGTYRGTVHSPHGPIAISLKLRGTTVGPIKISDIPLYCPGGGPAVPLTFPAVKLSITGAFTDRTGFKPKLGPFKGKITSRLRIIGKFASGGKMSAKITVVNLKFPACGGSTAFTAKR